MFLVSILLVIAIFLISYEFIRTTITGYVPYEGINLSIGSKIEGKVTVTLETGWVVFGDSQTIYAEFTNIGSESVSETITLNIKNSSLFTIYSWIDDSKILLPGEKRVFEMIFTPHETSLYYVQARVPYDGRIAEGWNAFMVYVPEAPEYPPYAPYPPSTPPALPITPIEIGREDMELEYPEIVTLNPGESTLLYIIVKNTGEVSLKDMKVSFSAPRELLLDIIPKYVFKLPVDRTTIFLVSVKAPYIPGIYSINFDISTRETKKSGTIAIDVRAIPVRDEVYQTILNYEFMIDKIQTEIDKAFLDGFNVTDVMESLDKAKISLNVARQHYNLMEYEKTKEELEMTKKHIEDTIFELSMLLTPEVIRPMAYFPLLILLFIIILTIFLVVYTSRKKKRRPRLLEEMEKEKE